MIKVAGTSRSTAVAGAIAAVIREETKVSVRAIGAGAVNQAVKAVCYARNFLAEDGIDVVCVPEFVKVQIDEQEKTAVCLNIRKQESGTEITEPDAESE